MLLELTVIIIPKMRCMLNIRGALSWMTHMMIIHALTLSNGDLWKC